MVRLHIRLLLLAEGTDHVNYDALALSFMLARATSLSEPPCLGPAEKD